MEIQWNGSLPFRSNPPANGWRGGGKGWHRRFWRERPSLDRNFVAPIGQRWRRTTGNVLFGLYRTMTAFSEKAVQHSNVLKSFSSCSGCQHAEQPLAEPPHGRQLMTSFLIAFVSKGRRQPSKLDPNGASEPPAPVTVMLIVSTALTGSSWSRACASRRADFSEVCTPHMTLCDR